MDIEGEENTISNLQYELRTQTAMIVLLALLNICTIGFCVGMVWFLMDATLP